MKRFVPVLAQGAGVLIVLGAVSALAGMWWAVLVAGAIVAAYGVLAEAGWV